MLRAARPGVGVGLVNVNARIVGRGGAYAVDASGGTNYGPFTADVLVRPGAQLAVDVRRVRVRRDRRAAAASCRPRRGRSRARCASPGRG